MRSITTDAVKCFFNCKNFKRSNTEVEKLSDWSMNFYLHWNTIASYDPKEKKLIISSAGWKTNTTKERLNGILSYFDLWGIFQKNWSRYFSDRSNKVVSFDRFMEFSL